MPTQEINVTAAFEVEGAGGALSPLKLADLQRSDPAAGPGALDASVQAVKGSVDALRTQLAAPIDVALSAPVSLSGAVDVADRTARVLGHVQVDNFPAFPATQQVAGTVGVSNFPSSQAVTGPFLTDSQLRATPVGVTGPLTDAQLRASAVGISASALPLPTGAATGAKQDAQTAELTTLAGVDFATEASLQAVSGKLGTPSSDDMLSLLRSIAANTLLETTKTDVLQLTADQVNLNTDQVEAKLDTVSTRIGTTGVAGSAVERIEAVRAAIAGTPAVSVSNWPATQPVSAAALPLPAGAATEATLAAVNTKLGGTLTVDTELSAAGPLALEATQASVLTQLQGGIPVTAFPSSLRSGGTATDSLRVDSELPAAAALTDTDGNPTVPGVGAYAMGWTTTAWRRLRADASGFMLVRPSLDPASTGDGNSISGGTVAGNWLYNAGTVSWDRWRVAPSGGGAIANTGVPMVAMSTYVGGGNYNPVGSVGASGAGDGTNLGSFFGIGNWAYNGASWDRRRNNLTFTALALAARTGTTASGNFKNYNGVGVRVYLNVTAASGTGGLRLQVRGADSVSGNNAAINALPTAITATGTYAYDVYPGATGGAVAQATSLPVGLNFNVQVTHVDSSSYTYSVSVETLTA